MGDNRGRNPFEKIKQRLRQRADQQLAEFRTLYSVLSDDDRSSLKTWLEKADELRNSMRATWDLAPLRVEYTCSFSDEDGNALYDGGFRLSPRLLLHAIDSWENNDDFTDHAGDILG